MRQGYLRREFSPVDVLLAAATRAEATSRFNAFVTPLFDRAVEQARRAERLYVRGEADAIPLLGVPVAVKDNYDTAGVRTTYGSSMFADHMPGETAECVRRLEAAGAIVVGKASLDEFAWGITGENPHFGPCRNPWDAARIPGGSSSGSATAVALRVAPLALGSDTAGSIRIPAGFCGIVGLKPTYDRLSRAGLFPLAPTFDHVGLLAREPVDLALLLGVLDDHPRLQAVAVPKVEAKRPQDEVLRDLRVGVLQGPSLDELDDDVARVVRAAMAALRSQGAELVEIGSRLWAHVLGMFVPVQQAEAYFTHRSRDLFPAHRRKYGDDVRERLELGESVSLADYLAARAEREHLAAGLRALFASVDVLLTPLGAARTPTFASLTDSTFAAVFRKRVLLHTVPASVAGIPSCAVRAGFDRDGLPVGVQFSAPQGADGRLLEVVGAYFGSTAHIQGIWPSA